MFICDFLQIHTEFMKLSIKKESWFFYTTGLWGVVVTGKHNEWILHKSSNDPFKCFYGRKVQIIFNLLISTWFHYHGSVSITEQLLDTEHWF